MKSSGDLSNIQKQQFFNDSNLLEDNKLNSDKKVQEKKPSAKFEKFQRESKYSFVVDWQITD